MRFLITDLETTGLDPQKHGVLELHVRTVEAESLEEVSAFHALLSCSLDGMSDFIRAMHTKNGLLEAVKPHPHLPGVAPRAWVKSPGLVYSDDVPPGPAQVGLMLEAYCRRQQVNADPKSLMLAGNSIHALDVPMLRAWMPQLFGVISHRTLDVSGVRTYYREVLQLELPAVVEALIKGGDSTHRAADDTLTCLCTLRMMRAWHEKGSPAGFDANGADAEAAGWQRDWTHPNDNRGAL